MLIYFLESDTNISKHLTELSLNLLCLNSKLISTRLFFGNLNSKLFMKLIQSQILCTYLLKNQHVFL